MKVGVKVNPHILAHLFRAGVVISGDAFRIRLVENAIPQDLELIHAGQAPETKEFYFVFGMKGERVSGPVSWQTPIYEKERDHGTEA